MQFLCVFQLKSRERIEDDSHKSSKEDERKAKSAGKTQKKEKLIDTNKRIEDRNNKKRIKKIRVEHIISGNLPLLLKTGDTGGFVFLPATIL